MRFLRSRRGQAATEFAISLPVLVLLMLGISDLARAFYLSIEIAGAGRAGARIGITSDTADIGDFIRSEPNTAIPNTVASWGNTGPGQVNANCTSSTAQNCGDPNGCPASAFAPNQVACFAVRPCELGSGGDTGACTAYGAWGARPESSSKAFKGIEVVVVYRFSPVTPFVANMSPSPDGKIYMTRTQVGDELYFS